MTLVVNKQSTPIIDFLMEATLQNDYKEIGGTIPAYYATHKNLIDACNFAIGLSRVLNDICVKNSDLPQKKSRDFCGKLGTRPTISIRDYTVNRLLRYMKPSIEILSMALVLIDKLISRTEGLLITSENVHRLLSIAVVISTKFAEDVFYDNEYYAKVAGITLTEFSSLELLFFTYVDFDVWISEDIIFTYKKLIDTIVTE
jgi:hypothetical protein